MDNTIDTTAEVAEEVTEEVAEETTEEIEETAEEATDEAVEETTAEVEEDVPKTVPLTALHQEREKTKTLKQQIKDYEKVLNRLKESTGVKDTRELEERMDNITLQEYVQNQGMDEQTARTFLMQQKKISELEKAQGAKDYAGEIQKLSTSPFYADIEEVADDVTEYAAQKNITAKEAYNILYAEQRALTLQKEAEQKALKQSATKQSKKISALSSSGNAQSKTQNTIKLTPTEAWAAKMAGMTPAEYDKYRKKE